MPPRACVALLPPPPPPPRDPAPDLSSRAAHPSRSSPQASAPHPSTKPSFAPRRSLLLLLAAAMLPALGQAQTGGVSVPLMLAPDSERQGFVRIINETDQAGRVRITAVDDAGNDASPIEIDLEAGASVHFNSDDLAYGNSAKGIDSIGQPRQGHWRLRVEAAEGVQVMAFVRTRAGFLTAMHDVLPRNDQGRILARMLNPGSNRSQESSLRLVNTGTNSERVSIRGVDDRSRSAGPVTLTLPAGQARTISAFDLENGAQGLTGSLGDGGGKWRLTIEAGQSVMGMGLLATPGGPITNISTIGLPPAERGPTDPGGQDDQGNSFANPFNLAVGGRVSGSIDPAGESDYYRIRVSQSGTLEVYTSGSLDTRGYLYDSGERQLASNDDGGASDDENFRIQREVDAGTYYVRVEAYLRNATGAYTVHAELDASTEPEPPTDPGSACRVGMVLSPGDSCTVGEHRFSVTSGGRGCYRGPGLSLCAGGGSIPYNGFRASKISGTNDWRIDALPSTDPTPPDPARGYYGALAVNSQDAPGPWLYGHSTNASTEAEADRIAINSCAAQITASGDRCSVTDDTRFGSGQCIVVYRANRGYWLNSVVGSRARLSSIQQQALSSCREQGYSDCRRVISACNSGTASIAPQTPPMVLEKR